MKKISILLLTILMSVCQLTALSEVDELGGIISDSFKSGRVVSVEQLNGWISCCPQQFLDEVYSNFGISRDLLDENLDMSAFSDFIEESLSKPEAKLQYKQTISQLTPVQKNRIIPLLFSYMIGLIARQ